MAATWRLGGSAPPTPGLHQPPAHGSPHPAPAPADDGGSARPNPVDLLRSESLFGGLGEPALRRLAAQLSLQHFAPRETIVRKGEIGDCWYLIADGAAAVVHADLVGREVTLATLGRGQSFGERALLTHQPRAATVRATTPLVAYVLDQHACRRVTAADPAVADRIRGHLDLLEIDTFLKRASPFARLPQATLWRLVAHLRPCRMRAAETIVREGDAADSLYLVRSGRAEVHRGRRRVAVLEAGDVFGEVALLMGERRTASVRALEDVELLCLAKEDFQAVVDEQPSLGGFFRELVQIRFRAATRQPLPGPEAAATIGPLAFPRRRPLYWLSAVAGALIFALLTVLASWRPDLPLLYAALAFGSFLGPALFVRYLAESHILRQRTRALALTASLAAAIGLPAAIALQHAAGIVPSSLGAALAIAAIEEPAKVLGVLWLVRRASLRFQMDGVIYGAAAGMGFAVCETMLYGLARVDTVGVLLTTLWLRTLLAPFTHGTWTALLCAVLWRQRGAGPLRGGRKVALVVGAVVLLHGLWNWRPFAIPLSFAWLLLVGAASVLLLRWVLRRATREEAAAVLALNPELQEAVTPGPTPRCRACRQAAPGGAHYCPRCSLALGGGPQEQPLLPGSPSPRQLAPRARAMQKGTRP